MDLHGLDSRVSLVLVASLILSIVAWLSYLAVTTGKKSLKNKHASISLPQPDQNIVPLTDFDWATTTPLRLRPFKPQYHLTMSIANSSYSELVEVDDTYLDRIRLRRDLAHTQAHAVLACNARATAAVVEFHEWMFGTYLPQRFPTMFALEHSHSSKHSMLKNMVTDELVAINEQNPETALRNINSQVDTDFLFLLPSSKSSDGQPIYHLEAFITCFPNGFSTRSKLSLPLATIHKPVPGYTAKLERSMDRYFARLPFGTVVKRANWSVTTHSKLFVESGNHLYKEEDVLHDVHDAAEVEKRRRDYRQQLEQQKRDVVIDQCRLRAERQTLHRLPQSGAIVFGIKTYLYTLESVKADGDGLTLADAIDGLGKGNVPEIQFYKRGIIWGERVAEYLRSPT